MKRLLDNRFVWMIIGALICGTTGVIASSYVSSDISYTPVDSNWKVNNVAEAINSIELSKISDNYSTEEKVVGTWIDGKPLYQKTITHTFAAETDSSRHWVNILNPSDIISNIDDIHIDYGASYMVGSTNKRHVPVSYPVDRNSYFILVVTPTSLDYVSEGLPWTDEGSNTLVITLRYTKTTDQATNS